MITRFFEGGQSFSFQEESVCVCTNTEKYFLEEQNMWVVGFDNLLDSQTSLFVANGRFVAAKLHYDHEIAKPDPQNSCVLNLYIYILYIDLTVPV